MKYYRFKSFLWPFREIFILVDKLLITIFSYLDMENSIHYPIKTCTKSFRKSLNS